MNESGSELQQLIEEDRRSIREWNGKVVEGSKKPGLDAQVLVQTKDAWEEEIKRLGGLESRGYMVGPVGKYASKQGVDISGVYYPLRDGNGRVFGAVDRVKRTIDGKTLKEQHYLVFVSRKAVDGIREYPLTPQPRS